MLSTYFRYAGISSLVDTELKPIPLAKQALLKLTSYLAHPYPKIRSSASEHIHLVVTSVLVNSLDEEVMNECEDLLLQCEWDDKNKAEACKKEILEKLNM